MRQRRQEPNPQGKSLLFSVFIITGRKVHPHWNNCEEIRDNLNSIGGAEDTEILSVYPPLFILSLEPNRREFALDQKEEGSGGFAIFNAEEKKITHLEVRGYNKVLHPHGISVYKTKDDRTLLFAINHQINGADQVLIFELIGDHLNLIEEVESKLFTSINDLVAVDERRFYVTNDHKYRLNELLFIFEDLIPKMSHSNLLFCEIDKECFYSISPGSHVFLNGVNHSPFHIDNAKFIYLSSTGDKSIYVYQRTIFNKKNNNNNIDNIDNNIDDGKLELVRKIWVNSGVDNIIVDQENGSLWIGSHPNSLRFLIHAKDSNSPAPSHVIHIINPNGDINNLKIEEIYLSNGGGKEDISASSTAARVGDYLIITPVFDDHILLCKHV